MRYDITKAAHRAVCREAVRRGFEIEVDDGTGERLRTAVADEAIEAIEAVDTASVRFLRRVPVPGHPTTRGVEPVGWILVVLDVDEAVETVADYSTHRSGFRSPGWIDEVLRDLDPPPSGGGAAATGVAPIADFGEAQLRPHSPGSFAGPWVYRLRRRDVWSPPFGTWEEAFQAALADAVDDLRAKLLAGQEEGHPHASATGWEEVAS